MSPLTKAFVVLATLLSVVMVSLTVAHVARTENYRTMFTELKNDRDSAVQRAAQEQAKLANQLAAMNEANAGEESELADVRGDLTDTLGEIRSRDERIAGLESNLARMTAANNALSATLTSATDRLNAQDEQIRTLIGNTGDLSRQKGELQQAIAIATAARDRYANEVRRLTEALQASEAASAAFEERKNELEEVIIAIAPNVDPATVIPPGNVRIAGAVTKVDQIGDGLTLVEVNVGTRDGVRANMPFTISRGDQYVGTITITTVDTDKSVGELTLNNGSIRDGDDASTGS